MAGTVHSTVGVGAVLLCSAGWLIQADAAPQRSPESKNGVVNEAARFGTKTAAPRQSTGPIDRMVQPSELEPAGAGEASADTSKTTERLRRMQNRRPRSAELTGQGSQEAERWQPIESLDAYALNVARKGHTATVLDDGRVLFIGGENDKGPVPEAEILDLFSQTLHVVAASLEARTDHTATLLGDGRVLVAGGSGHSGRLRSTEIFDPETGTFSPGPNLRRPRSGHTATSLAKGRILIAGGSDRSAEIFNPKRERFKRIRAQMKEPRSFHGAERLEDGRVLLAGGLGRDGEPLDTAEVFDPKRMRFVTTITWMYAARVRPTLNVLPDGKVQVIGGDDSGTMEVYDPTGMFFRGHVSVSQAAAQLSEQELLAVPTRAALAGAFAGDHEEVLSRVDAFVNRRDFGAAEIAPLKQAVIAGGIRDNGQYLRSVVLLKASPAVLSTSRTEYLPGSRPILTGSGWRAGERIEILRHSMWPGQRPEIFRTTADAKGGLANVELGALQHRLGAYLLTARGLSSGSVAQTSYRIGPHFDLERFLAVPKPTRVTFTIPLDQPHGRIHTALGPLEWHILEAASADFPTSQIPECFELRGVEVCSGNVQLRVDTDNSHFDGDFELVGSAAWDPGCWEVFGLVDCGEEGSRLPEFQLGVGFDETLDMKLALLLSGQGDPLTLEGPIPGMGTTVQFTLNETLGFKGSVDLAVRAEFELNFDEPIKVLEPDVPGTALRPFFEVDQTCRAELRVSTSGVQTPANCPSPAVDAGAPFVNLGQIRAELAVGPQLDASLDAPICGNIGSISFGLRGFADAAFVPREDPSLCWTYRGELGAGGRIKSGGAVSCNDVSYGFDLLDEEFRSSIPVGDRIVFADEERPTVVCPKNIEVHTEAGLCSASVEWDLPTASDACSGGIREKSTTPASPHRFEKGLWSVVGTATDNAAAVTDGRSQDNTNSCQFSVAVVDVEPPLIQDPMATPTLLWPPNHKMRDIMVTYVATDNCEVSCSLSATSNEPDNGLGDGDKPNDIRVLSPHHVRLRAERSGKGVGRVYSINVACSDDSGNTASETVTVEVPKRRKK